MPSYYESLSMVALEAWALGRPVLANATLRRAARPVPTQQCRPVSIDDAEEFGAALDAILDDPALATDARRTSGGNISLNHYRWPVIERKYLDMLTQLASAPADARMEPLPGRAGAPAQDKPPAADVVAAAAVGPARDDRTRSGHASMKFAFVTPRYGADISGGAEHACRLLAEQFSAPPRRRRADDVRARLR